MVKLNLSKSTRLKTSIKIEHWSKVKWFKAKSVTQSQLIQKVRHSLSQLFTCSIERWQLTIPGMALPDEGNYTCIVHNKHGILNHTFKVEALTYLTHRPGRSMMFIGVGPITEVALALHIYMPQVRLVIS